MKERKTRRGRLRGPLEPSSSLSCPLVHDHGDMAAKKKSWLGEFWRPLAALLLWVLGMVPLIAAPPLLPSVAETRIGGLTAFPVDCIPAAPLFPSDLTRACGPPLYDVASECSVAAKSGVGSLDDMSRAAGAADRNGLTQAGRALQKHGDRPGSAFPQTKGGPGKLNPAGQDIVDDVLTTPGSVNKPNRFGGVDVTAPDGRGVRYDANGKMMGFLEP